MGDLQRTLGAGERPAFRLLSVCLVVLAASGCLAGANGAGSTPEPEPTAAPTASPTASPTPPAALDSTLVQLVHADNRTAYAERHGLELRNGRVLVVIELADGTLPEDVDVQQTLTRDGEVLGYVPIEQLDALARSQNVSAVRPPERGVTNRLSSARTHQIPHP